MNAETITMDPEEAREQLRAYRRQVHRRADAEYEAVVKGLEALSDGTPILSLPDAIARGGFDEQGRPRIAIARADRRAVNVSWREPLRWSETRSRFYPRGTVWFDAAATRGPVNESLQIPVTLPAELEPADSFRIRGSTLVPMIPAHVRNAVQFRDRDCFILWEVEKWEPVPSRDPFLLRHLHGDAYAVLAEWDLTPLEQMVMAGRRSS